MTPRGSRCSEPPCETNRRKNKTVSKKDSELEGVVLTSKRCNNYVPLRGKTPANFVPDL